MGARYSPEVLGDGGDGGGIGSHCEGVGVVADKGEVGGGRAYAVGVAQDAEAVNAVSDVEIDFLGGAGVEVAAVADAVVAGIAGDAADIVGDCRACRRDGHAVGSVDFHGLAGAVDVGAFATLTSEVGGVVVVVEGGVFVLKANDGADRSAAAGDGRAGVDAVSDGTLVAAAHDAADDVIAADAGCAGATGNSALVADDAADIVLLSADADAAGDEAVGNMSLVFSFPEDGADVGLATDGAVVNLQVLDGGFCASVAEESDAAGRAEADVNAADSLAIAVEGAFEGVRTITNGREVVRCVLIISNVAAQLEELALVGIASAHPAGEQVEVFGSADDVGVVGSVTAVVYPPVIDDVKTRGSGSVFEAVAVAGNGGLHPVGAGSRGFGGGIGAVLRRAVFIGNGSRTEVIADEAGHRCRSLKIIGARYGDAAVGRLGDGDLVDLCLGLVTIGARASVVFHVVCTGIGGFGELRRVFVEILILADFPEPHFVGVVVGGAHTGDEHLLTAVIDKSAGHHGVSRRAVGLRDGVDVHVDVGRFADSLVQGYFFLM